MSALEIHSQNPGTGEQGSKNMDTYLDESKLEANQPNSKGGTKSKKLTMLPLMFLIYFAVSGGPFGEEPTVKAAGPLLAIIGFLVFPFIWSIPEALITAELATSFPDNGGYVVWADEAFGPFWGFSDGFFKIP
ncbi:hypothetical protein IFM89_038115 [Coptis chinensis]|uniref:Polyamine transporter n=1 Tax=Coptis chinensis TaxID=261450 RepID=A0A835HSY6_9MAGN|nr:hypothetical protein IFM89_038115 [Coptis chinensis]